MSTASTAPISPDFTILGKNTIIYRGSNTRVPFDGQFFSIHKSVAKLYAYPYLHKYKLKHDVVLINLMDSITRDYFASIRLGANSPYEEYINPGTSPVPQGQELPQPNYADAPETAPRLVTLVQELSFKGWLIPPGSYWYRNGNPEPFHTEVMIVKPGNELDFIHLISE